MNIGEITLEDGRLVGAIATRDLDFPKVGLRPVRSESDRAPAYEIITRNVGGRWVQIGALWAATQKSTGEEFLQGMIDDPSLAQPLPIALFGNRTDGYNVAWRRPQRQDDFGPVTRASRGGAAPSGGGFGDSTAGADGALMNGDVDLSDEIPF